jgi:vancomycin aglycone glucosyltransferase
MMEGTVATQFEAIPRAAQGCDVIAAGNALQIAARSVAEQRGIRYVFAAYCPITLPSPHHAPPKVLAWTPKDPTADNRTLWAEDAQRWSERWGPALNSHRASAGLAPVTDVRSHILSDKPWLAADPTLAPWPEPADPDVFQTGAWILPDHRPLSPELEMFLEAGEPAGLFRLRQRPRSRRPRQDDDRNGPCARTPCDRVARMADLSLVDKEPDGLSIGEVNQQALFQRVAAVVHHGGAGTTTAAIGAGAPQVVIPQHHDQFYFAQRVNDLGIGSAHPRVVPATDSLASALKHTLQPGVAARCRATVILTPSRH